MIKLCVLLQVFVLSAFSVVSLDLELKHEGESVIDYKTKVKTLLDKEAFIPISKTKNMLRVFVSDKVPKSIDIKDKDIANIELALVDQDNKVIPQPKILTRWGEEATMSVSKDEEYGQLKTEVTVTATR